MAHNQEKIQSLETNHKMSHMLELTGKNFKAGIITKFKDFKGKFDHNEQTN